MSDRVAPWLRLEASSPCSPQVKSPKFAALIYLHPHTHTLAPTRATDCIPACLPVTLPFSFLPACLLGLRLYSSPRTLTADESDAPSHGTCSTAYRRTNDHRTDDKPTISRRRTCRPPTPLLTLLEPVADSSDFNRRIARLRKKTGEALAIFFRTSSGSVSREEFQPIEGVLSADRVSDRSRRPPLVLPLAIHR